MRARRLAVVSVVALLVGCQRNERAPEAAPPPTAAAAGASAPVVHKAGDRVDVHGIDVQFLDGGLIAIHGRDRWGNPLDTTYENSEFLRRALPVLERSITAEQLAGLRALVGVR